MIRNSTKKFKEKYAYSSVKKIEVVNRERDQSESSFTTFKFNTTQYLCHTKSTPKLQNSKKQLHKTQPLIYNNNKTVGEEKNPSFTDHTSIETIQTVMKKKGIEDSQASQHRAGKLKRVHRNSCKNRDSQDFIENLPKNSIFFCCECYQYIFDIEKHRHFPDCKDQISKFQTDISKIGKQKLKKIVQLANYTETNAQLINELYSEFLNGTLIKLAALDYPKYHFFALKEITYAFAYIFDQLLRNEKYQSDSTIFSCF